MMLAYSSTQDVELYSTPPLPRVIVTSSVRSLSCVCVCVCAVFGTFVCTSLSYSADVCEFSEKLYNCGSLTKVK